MPTGRAKARELIDNPLPFAAKGTPTVGLEPSCLLTLRDEALTMGFGEPAQKVSRRYEVAGTMPRERRSRCSGRNAPRRSIVRKAHPKGPARGRRQCQPRQAHAPLAIAATTQTHQEPRTDQ